jgi:sec-independent protein translocase protein TatB
MMQVRVSANPMLSISHLIIIFLVALIVFGPEKLPDLARNLSKLMREFNRATGGLRESLEQDLRQLEREVLEQRQAGTAPPPAATPLPAPDPAPGEPAGTAEPAAGPSFFDAPTAELTAAPLPAGATASPPGTDSPSTEPSPEKAVDGRPTAA